MLVRFFRSHQPALLIILPILAALLWLPAFLHPITPVVKHHMPLFELLVKPMLGFPLFSTFVAFVLLLIQAFLFNYILDKYEIMGKASYLPVLLYIVFTSFSKNLLYLHPVLFGNIFILLALNRVLGTYRKPSALSPCFDAGFLIAMASLFYFPAIIVLLFVLIAVFILRPFSWRELAIVLMGFLLPYIYINTYYFLFPGLEYLWADKILIPLVNRTALLDDTNIQLYAGFILFVVIALVLSIGRGSDSNRSVQHRSNVTVLRLFFVVGVLTLILAPGLNYIYFFVAMIPLVAFIANYFLWARMVWLSEIIFWVLIVCVLYNHY